MSKFRVLQSNQAYMAKIGIYSYRLTEPTNEFFSSIATYFMLFFMFTFNECASAMWILRHSDQLIPILDTCKVIIISSQAVGMFISIGLKMTKVKKLHLQLQRIVDDGSQKHSSTCARKLISSLFFALS